jgi:hypothetical protein
VEVGVAIATEQYASLYEEMLEMGLDIDQQTQIWRHDKDF